MCFCFALLSYSYVLYMHKIWHHSSTGFATCFNQQHTVFCVVASGLGELVEPMIWYYQPSFRDLPYGTSALQGVSNYVI